MYDDGFDVSLYRVDKATYCTAIALRNTAVFSAGAAVISYLRTTNTYVSIKSTQEMNSINLLKYRLIVPLLIAASSLRAEVAGDSVAVVRQVDEVVVTGTRAAIDLRLLSMQVSVIERSAITQRRETSLLPLLNEQVPGLFVTSRGIMGYGVSTGAAGGMNMRGIGGSPNTRMLILIDGEPQYAGLMGHPIPDAYQAIMAGRIEVVRGPASVVYGSNAMGGVINIVSDRPAAEQVTTAACLQYGSYNTLQASAHNKICKRKFASVIAASYNRSDGHRANMDFEQYSGSIKLTYHATDNWTANANADMTYFEASNPGTVSAPLIDNDSRILRGTASVGIDNHYDNASGALRLFYNWGRHKINDGYSAGEQPLDYRFNLKDRLAGASIYETTSLTTGNKLTIGIDYQNIGGEAWNKYLSNDSLAYLADRTEHDVAAYVDLRQTLGQRFGFDIGLRADNHSRSGLEWVPQVGVTVQVISSAQLKLQVAKGFRNPTLRELYMFAAQNPDLETEKLWNYELSWSHKAMQGRWQYSACLFLIDADNLIQTTTVDGRSQNLNTGALTNYGLELEASYQITDAMSLNVNYSYLHMDNPATASPEHKLYASLSYAKRRLACTTSLQYVGNLYIATSPDETEDYVLWNMRATFQASGWLKLFARAENLLAQKYQINKGFPMPKATIFAGIEVNI